MKYAFAFIVLVPVVAVVTYIVTIVTMSAMYSMSNYSDTAVTVLVFASIVASTVAIAAYRLGERGKGKYDKEIIRRLYLYV